MIVNMQIRKHISWPLSLLFIAGLFLGSYGRVLCVGDEGHVKVESVCQPCCSDPEIESSLAHKNAGHDFHNDCGDCTDLPLDQNTLSYRLVTQKTDIGSVNVDCFPEFIASVGDQTTLVATAPTKVGPGSPATELSISTTVLLC